MPFFLRIIYVYETMYNDVLSYTVHFLSAEDFNEKAKILSYDFWQDLFTYNSNWGNPYAADSADFAFVCTGSYLFTYEVPAQEEPVVEAPVGEEVTAVVSFAGYTFSKLGYPIVYSDKECFSHCTFCYFD